MIVSAVLSQIDSSKIILPNDFTSYLQNNYYCRMYFSIFPDKILDKSKLSLAVDDDTKNEDLLDIDLINK